MLLNMIQVRTTLDLRRNNLYLIVILLQFSFPIVCEEKSQTVDIYSDEYLFDNDLKLYTVINYIYIRNEILTEPGDYLLSFLNQLKIQKTNFVYNNLREIAKTAKDPLGFYEAVIHFKNGEHDKSITKKEHKTNIN